MMLLDYGNYFKTISKSKGIYIYTSQNLSLEWQLGELYRQMSLAISSDKNGRKYSKKILTRGLMEQSQYRLNKGLPIC